MPENPDQFEELDLTRRPDQEGDSLEDFLSHYWRLLRQYYWLLILFCIAGAVGAYFWTQYEPKIYTASSEIVFRQSSDDLFGREIQKVDLLDPGNRWQFEQFWKTQKQVFQTNRLLRKVVEKENLLDHPRFLEDGKDDRDESDRMDAAIGKLRSVTNIKLASESRVAVITSKTQDPELSATIANGLADAYIDYTEDYQSGGLKRMNDWFNSYVAKKRSELEKAQSKLQKFKRKNNILTFTYEDRQNLTVSKMESVNKELVRVRNELSAKMALLNQIEQMTESNQTREAVADLVESPQLKRAFERRDKLKEELARYRAKYLDKHPKIRSLQAQIETVQSTIDSQLRRIEKSVQNRVRVLQNNVDNLEGQLGGLKSQVFELNELAGKYTQLKNRKQNLKELYDTVLQRSSELDINTLYKRNDIEVLERAEPPASYSSPSLPLNLAVGFALGAALGGLCIIFLDALDTTVQSEEDIREITDRPILTILPELTDKVLAGVETIGESPADTITHSAPKSSFAEGIKTLRTNLTFMAPDSPPASILVTSPGPGEGKTLSATNMAIAIAQSGKSTLLVDSDLRRPRVHRALNLEKDAGLSDVITGKADLEDVVQETATENLYALTSGEVPPNPSELLHSEAFENMVRDAERTFDRVVFDSPPLAAVSDALIISSLVDGVLLILESGKTRRETLTRSLEQLEGIGAPLLGFVLNEVALDSTAYGYSSYRYQYYGEYSEEETPDRLAS